MQFYVFNNRPQIASLEVAKITRHTVANFLNFTSSLLLLFFVQPLSVNSVINCGALQPLHSCTFLIKILFSLLNGAMLTGSVMCNFQNLCYFRCPVWKLIKGKLTQKLKHANSILEYLEYFCQMSSKSIITISSYTFSKFARFLRHIVYASGMKISDTKNKCIKVILYSVQ